MFCGGPSQLPFHPGSCKRLYHVIPTNSVGEQEYLAYKMFDVNQSVQSTGNTPEQLQFRELLCYFCCLIYIK